MANLFVRKSAFTENLLNSTSMPKVLILIIFFRTFGFVYFNNKHLVLYNSKVNDCICEIERKNPFQISRSKRQIKTLSSLERVK